MNRMLKMKRAIAKAPRVAAGKALLAVAVAILVAGQPAQADPLDGLEREELEARLDEARAQLDEAAARLGELHGRLYAMETVGGAGRRPMLGVLLGGRGPSGGLMVAGVTPGSGAERAGLVAGDELTSVGNQDLTAGANLQKALQDVEPGQDVSVGFKRDGSFGLVSVATQARGVYIMDMTGAPDVDIEIEGLQALEGLAERFVMEPPPPGAFAHGVVVEDIEVLEADGGVPGAVASRAIRIGGGLRLEAVRGDLAAYFGVDEGVLILSVPESTTSNGDGLDGLKGGDILLSVAGEPVDSVGAAYRALLGPGPGSAEALVVEVLRQGTTRTVELTPGMLGHRAYRSISYGEAPAVDVRITP